ncbi:hypothetical protein Y032_0009g640 [Ancylostoma ceylanicum]|uniref:Uncharacterized protein n=1 Tax=Ancylostoma ceylanicum TaxID=53326 RepID=A0A016VJT3_9BILA|nr:hypothetical protein Y032_0009g640 [Ancylostoma ceylanicum]
MRWLRGDFCCRRRLDRGDHEDTVSADSVFFFADAAGTQHGRAACDGIAAIVANQSFLGSFFSSYLMLARRTTTNYQENRIVCSRCDDSCASGVVASRASRARKKRTAIDA